MDRYQSALDYLYSFVSYEQKSQWDYNNKSLNLERFQRFLAKLGNPQHQARTLHVAGSDGKGSVCTMLVSVLREMGYKVGQYLSPHLWDIRERIQVDGEWISQEGLANWTFFLKRHIDASTPLPEGYATFFELMTAMAFLHFAQEGVDFAVIETGLGGRLDATNVLHPESTILTHISKEHTVQLGDTLPQIADEKLGIVRPGVPVVIGPQDPDLLPHFKSRLAAHEAQVIYVDEDYQVSSLGVTEEGRRVCVEGGRKAARLFDLALIGRYQMQNVMTALATLDVLENAGRIGPVTDLVLQQAMKKVRWAGRFELWRSAGQAVTIFDVSHTAKGAAALRMALDELYPVPGRVIVFGVLKGKAVREMVQALRREGDRWILTQAPTPRAQDVVEIEKAVGDLFAPGQIVARIAEPSQAYAMARTLVEPSQVVVVTGSIYLVGEVQKGLRKPVLI
ncbi:MAG: folylpolyglutamate synthase/dihydrofolate synthase family protein [bacterium]|jgi:dihydrofolate synthase/folylpolyglutamate synthase|nr:folylpolyglutamate synthase/dihydrofolate synthase family protein [bacterium]